mgnify:CR=1 FL=1
MASLALGALRSMPRTVWILGLVSLLMDTSSEMIHGLLPIYLVSVLGISMLAVGVIEGIAEATAAIVKVFSGALSDWLGRRKELTALGYGLAAVSKPVFPLATGVSAVVAARFIDRVGKGIRGAPRDALIADVTPEAMRGAAFGLRQALDTVGAFLGPLIAILLMLATANNFTYVFWIAVIPAFLSLALAVFGVQEPDTPSGTRRMRSPLSLAELQRLGPGYWWVVAVAAVATLARFSDAFLVLRAQGLGLPVAWVPAVMVLMNIVYALASYPAGALSDRIGRRGVLSVGLAILVASDMVLAFAGGVAGVALGVALWGLHMGATQGLLSAMVADSAPAELRGTAFGVFNLVSGVALLVASALAGALWDQSGPAATFLAGAVLTLAALLAVVSSRTRSLPQ